MVKDKVSLKDIIQKTSISRLDIVPSGETMVNLELQLHSAIGRDYRLKNILENSELQKYDFVLIDNAPHVELAMINSLYG